MPYKKGWFVAWHHTTGGPDNISASARDALLNLLQTEEMAQAGKLKIRVKWRRTHLMR